MERLASLSDMEAALGGEVEPDELRVAETLLDEASALVCSFARAVPALATVPDEVRLVTARVAARALNAGGGDMPVGMSQYSVNAGPFGHSGSFAEGTNDGGPWLTKADKMVLRRWRGGAYTVRMW